MQPTTRRLFTTVFDSEEVLSRARQLGAVRRLREIHPAELCPALTHCAMMRSTHPRLEPSPHRVLALLLLKLPAMVTALGTRALPGVLRTFLAALWREGINPNPGRPYRSNWR